MNQGFRWCTHCGEPHGLADRICRVTGKPLESVLHARTQETGPSALVDTVLDGKYRILKAIGVGGMGMVFEAENLLLRRRVAVKVVAKTSSWEANQRLQHEAQLIASIRHPNICDVYDIGMLQSGGPYVVLERLVGETLAQLMKRSGKLPVTAVVDVIVQVLSGLQAAHSANIIHRDLKPQNLFLAERVGCSPIAKIVDFGFARDITLESAKRITRPGYACGTVQYMSPEQLNLRALDHRSDLFSLGVVLYEALAGRHPFAAPSMPEMRRNLSNARAVPLRQVRPDVPREIEAIVAWAMSKDPAERPSSAYEMQQALASAAVGAVSLADEDVESIHDDDDEDWSLTTPMWQPMCSSSTPSA